MNIIVHVHVCRPVGKGGESLRIPQHNIIIYLHGLQHRHNNHNYYNVALIVVAHYDYQVIARQIVSPLPVPM